MATIVASMNRPNPAIASSPAPSLSGSVQSDLAVVELDIHRLDRRFEETRLC
ncbi:MAG: hypothetical protein HQL48_06800, partial [Gammaproteobacteria bacterium]|nr:hypothetical protein [Gammaproteobacteria bacterium]